MWKMKVRWEDKDHEEQEFEGEAESLDKVMELGEIHAADVTNEMMREIHMWMVK